MLVDCAQLSLRLILPKLTRYQITVTTHLLPQNPEPAEMNGGSIRVATNHSDEKWER